MNAKKFKSILMQAICGDKESVELLLKMYAPLINKNSFIKNEMNEDLRQYLLLHIIKNISKFKI